MHLTGGLGNQFFQLFNAFRFVNVNQKVIIETGNGSPVFSEINSNPIIQDFLSDDEILFEEKGTPCRFPKVKRNPKNPKGYDVIGYW